MMGPRGNSLYISIRPCGASCGQIWWGRGRWIDTYSYVISTGMRKLEMFAWFLCHMFLRGPTWESHGYSLGLMDLDMGPRGDSLYISIRPCGASWGQIWWGHGRWIDTYSYVISTGMRKLEMFAWFLCHMFLRGPTWESHGYSLGLMDLDIR
jgi:hypothetical protein